MKTIRSLLATAVLLGGVFAFSRDALAQIDVGAQQEHIVTIGDQPDASVKLENGQYRSGKFIYASKYYVVIEPKQAVRQDAMKMYGGLAVDWNKIDTFRIADLDVEIKPAGTTGDEILGALGSLAGATGSSKEPTTLYRERRKEERLKKPKKQDETAEAMKPQPIEPVPAETTKAAPPAGAAAAEAPATPAGTPIPVPATVEANPPAGAGAGPGAVAAEKVFVCSSCNKDVLESFAKTGKCPHCGVSFGNVTAATGAPAVAAAPAGPQVLTLPPPDPAAQQQSGGFDFNSMSLGTQIGIFAGIIAVLFIVVRVM